LHYNQPYIECAFYKCYDVESIKQQKSIIQVGSVFEFTVIGDLLRFMLKFKMLYNRKLLNLVSNESSVYAVGDAVVSLPHINVT